MYYLGFTVQEDHRKFVAQEVSDVTVKWVAESKEAFRTSSAV